jgi:GTP-binding protein
MELFDPELAAKPRVIAISKIDLPEVRSLLEGVTELLTPRGIPLIPVSSVTGEGLDRLVSKLYQLI